MKKNYQQPSIYSEKSFETNALLCGKAVPAPAGSRHFTSAYDTFTGHLGSGMGASSSVSPGQIGIGFGPGGTSSSYAYTGLCGNWVMLSS